jgi:hypothetical protein
MEEIDNCMEERRLFYVASSRAKKYLCISFAQDLLNNITISPFVRELNNINYIGSNLSKSFSTAFRLTGSVAFDITNYLHYFGYKDLATMVQTIPSVRSNIGVKTELSIPTVLKNRQIAGNMMDYLIAKMLQNHFNNIIEFFDLPLNNRNKFSEKAYYNYIDQFTDWRNMLNDIFIASSRGSKNIEDIDTWQTQLISPESLQYYISFEKALINFVNNIIKTPNITHNIKIHTNITYNNIRGELDVLIDDILIEMKTTPDDACTFPTLCQALIYCYLLQKKKIIVKKIIILNLWDGTMDTFDMMNNNVLFNYNKFRKILYNIPTETIDNNIEQ